MTIPSGNYKNNTMNMLASIMLCSSLTLAVHAAWDNYWDGPLHVSCPNGYGFSNIKVGAALFHVVFRMFRALLVLPLGWFDHPTSVFHPELWHKLRW